MPCLLGNLFSNSCELDTILNTCLYPGLELKGKAAFNLSVSGNSISHLTTYVVDIIHIRKHKSCRDLKNNLRMVKGDIFLFLTQTM